MSCALKHVDQALVLGPVLVDPGQFVARRPEGAARRMAQARDGRPALLAGVDHVLGQRAHDPMSAGVNFRYVIRILTRGFQHPAGRRIDDGRHSAGLGVERISGLRALHRPRRIAWVFDDGRLLTLWWRAHP